MAKQPSVNVSGTWRSVHAISVKVSGTWRQVTNAWVKVGGVWQQYFAAYTAISASIDPATYSNTVANSTGPYDLGFDAIVTGGDGTQTYTWSVTNTLGSGWSIVAGQGTASVTVRCADGSNQTLAATLECLVDDGTTNDTPSASLSMTYGTPP